MRKLALGLVSAGAFATLALGLATPAMAAPVTPTHDAAYSTQADTTYVQPVDCRVHVNTGGNDVDVSWC